MKVSKPLLQRMMEKIIPEPNSGCWLWVGACTSNGYGVTSPNDWRANRTLLAHRTFYELLRGPIPDGLELDHLCRVRCCVNPDHLEAVTKEENIRRSNWLGAGGRFHASKTKCPHGHPYSTENTYTHNGRRSCVACKAKRNRESRGHKT